MFRLFQFAFMPCIGITQGVLPLTGYNYGAGNLVRVRSIVRKGALAAGAITGFFSLLFVLFPGTFVRLFDPSPEFVALAGPGLRITSLMFAPVGASVVFSGFFQGIGRALPAMFLSLARQVIFFLPGLLILPRLFGLTGLWSAIPVADGLSIVASVVWTAVMFRKLGVPLFARGGRRSPG
jgi:Na+-driven multidrug efflux pump